MDGLAIIVIGLILCFLGVGSVHVAVPASGFAVAWTLADNFDASAATGLLIGLGGAATAWIVVSLIFRAAGFFVGAVAGAVIGSKLYTLLQGDDSSVVLALIFVLSMAMVAGFLTNRLRRRFLLWLCALGGAGIALSGLGTLAPGLEDWLHAPESSAQSVVNSLSWAALAIGGVIVQRRLFHQQIIRQE